MPTAQAIGADRNPQADTPDARATISSDERVRRQNARMPPSSTANGSSCMAFHGRCNAVISPTNANPASGFEAARRSNSRKSNNATSPVSANSTITTANMNWRAT